MQGIEKKEFEEIFKTYYEPIKNFVYYKVGDIDVGEDIVQEVFLRIWEKRENIRIETIKPLLYTIANNLCINRFDHKRVVLQFESSFINESNTESPEFVMELKEFDKKLQKTISSLKEKERIVFLMNRIDKYTYKEIADNLGITVKAVEKRMTNALRYFKKKIGYRI